MASRYVSSLAGGTGVGTEGDPFTLAQGISYINAGTLVSGETMWIIADGIYTTTGIALTSAGSLGVPGYKTIAGYSTVIGDGGQATIQRSGGAGDLFLTTSYWKLKNFIFDGQDSGTYNLRNTRNDTLIENVESYDAGTIGISGGTCLNCYSHDNGSTGFYTVSTAIYCVSANNKSSGFLGLSSGDYIVSYNDTGSGIASFGACKLTNSIIDSPTSNGISTAQQGASIINCVFSNIGGASAIDVNRDGIVAENNNFYNLSGNISNDMNSIGTYYELDPQFTNPATLDFTRTGTNLDDKGFSELGCQAFDYKIDIGIDQKKTCDLPAETDVRDGVTYDSGLLEGNLEVPAIADVRTGTTFGANGSEYTGTLDLPSINDVENGVTFDGATKTGNFVAPAQSNVVTGIGYGSLGTEYTGTYDEDYPSVNDVEDGVVFGNTVYTGTLEVPAQTNVRTGTGYGANGTQYTGSLDLPSINDVEDGVTFDGATKEGNFEAPAITNVKTGIGYGSLGTEYTGTLEFIFGFKVNIKRLDTLAGTLSPLAKGDSCNIQCTINTDLTGWKIRGQFGDNSGSNVQLANTASGGSDAQISIESATATSSVFIIKLPKNETTSFDSKGYLEVEVETDDSTTKIFTILKKNIEFTDEDITWETPS